MLKFLSWVVNLLAGLLWMKPIWQLTNERANKWTNQPNCLQTNQYNKPTNHLTVWLQTQSNNGCTLHSKETVWTKKEMYTTFYHPSQSYPPPFLQATHPPYNCNTSKAQPSAKDRRNSVNISLEKACWQLPQAPVTSCWNLLAWKVACLKYSFKNPLG